MASAHLKRVTVMMRNMTAEMLSVLVSLTDIYEATSHVLRTLHLSLSCFVLFFWFTAAVVSFRCACSTLTLEDSAICLTSEQSTMEIDRDDDSVLDVYFVSLCSTVSRLHLSQGHRKWRCEEPKYNTFNGLYCPMFFAKIFSVVHWLNNQNQATPYNPQYCYPGIRLVCQYYSF